MLESLAPFSIPLKVVEVQILNITRKAVVKGPFLAFLCVNHWDGDAVGSISWVPLVSEQKMNDTDHSYVIKSLLLKKKLDLIKFILFFILIQNYMNFHQKHTVAYIWIHFYLLFQFVLSFFSKNCICAKKTKFKRLHCCGRILLDKTCPYLFCHWLLED